MLAVFQNIINGAKLVLQEIEEEKVKKETERALELTKITPEEKK